MNTIAFVVLEASGRYRVWCFQHDFERMMRVAPDRLQENLLDKNGLHFKTRREAIQKLRAKYPLARKIDKSVRIYANERSEYEYFTLNGLRLEKNRRYY